jgi:Tfp pilus assembly protein PilN
MPVLNINLLRQEQSRISGIAQANFAVIVAVSSIVILTLLVTVFLYTTIAIRNGQKQGLIKQTKEYEQQIGKLNDVESPFYPDMSLEQQAVAYQKQVDAAGKLIVNHKYFTLYMSEIAENTPPTIVYNSFTSDSVNRLIVSGNADSYEDVAKLVESFKKLSFVKDVTLQEAKLDSSRVGRGGAVKFTMALELKSAGELKKLPGPTSSANPKPTSSATPSPKASP